MFKKWLYVIGWSAALLVATLPSIFKGELKFSLQDKTMSEVCELYMFPVIMALALLMADVLYTAEQEKVEEGRVHNTSILIICVMSFLFSFIFSLWIETAWLCWVFFGVTWTSMFFLKFSKTKPIPASPFEEGIEVPE